MNVDLVENLLTGKVKLSVIGLGYVGLPVAIAFDKHCAVIGYDISEKKIDLYRNGIDPTNEVGDQAVRDCNVKFTSNPHDLKEARFHIVAVPTPVTENKIPDLEPLESACRSLGSNMTAGSIAVFESTVYPGVTEEICIPILEKESGLVCGHDFKVGYSPERINPGDKERRLENIVKVVSGMDTESLDTIACVYEMIIEAGVHRAESIKVAEAAKVIENSQRDINIAFMNELSIIFSRLGIDTKAVLDAARTKWNFLPFYPGLVGGHCIGVDPYYLTYKARQVGYESQVILSGRRINDGMGRYVAENLVKLLIRSDRHVKNAKVAILGFTFKENCPDTRNTRVIDVVDELREYGIAPVVTDPVADKDETLQQYGIPLVSIEDIREADAVIVAVAHDAYRELSLDQINLFYNDGTKVLMDLKGILDRNQLEENGCLYWRL